jgi:peptidoglycan/xylan/chitin deacetylase (PgdA/CDA1 family)
MTEAKAHRSSRRATAWIVGAVVSVGLVGVAITVIAVRHPRTVTVAPVGTTATTPTTTTSTTTTTTTAAAPVPQVPPPATVPIPSGNLAPLISRVSTTDPVVFFTIDDGLVRDPAVIDFIRAHQIPVTLFPLPDLVHQDPAYFQSLHALGASIQDHTQHHPDLSRLGPAAQQQEICGPLDDYQALFDQRPWLLRTPGGRANASTSLAARACGMRAVIHWRATMNDGVLRTQGGPLQAGDIILMHFRTDLRQNLEVALNAAVAQGLHPAALESYLPPAA